jgi:hypothetical protein
MAMSSAMLVGDGLYRVLWSRGTRPDRVEIVGWPASLPGIDPEADAPSRRRPRRPVKRPLRRGRIQLVAA